MDNIQNHFLFIPTKQYSNVIVIVGLIAFCYYVIRSSNIKKYMKDDGYGSARWANKDEIVKLGEKKHNLLLADNVKLSTNTRYTKINK